MARITKRGADSATFDLAGPSWQWIADDDVPGFGLRLLRSGQKRFAVRYRTRSGRQRYLTLGTYGTLTVQQARDMARKELAKVLEGGDPLSERRRERIGVRTVNGLLTAWLDEYAKAHRKRWEEDERRVEGRIRPPLGKLALEDLTPGRLAVYHRSVGEVAPVEANRCVETIRAAWRWAEQEGRVPDGLTDPTRRVKRFRERSRDRWLRREEVARLIEVTDQEEDPFVRAAVRLLLLTALRKNELLTARWEHVDLDRGEIRLPETKSGEAQTRLLPSSAVEILRGLPRYSGNPHVFPSPVKRGAHRPDFRSQWERIRERAKLKDITLHDLRRTAGSFMAQSGVPLQTIQHVLGHSHPGVSRLYARLASENEREALETLANELSDVHGSPSPKKAGKSVEESSTHLADLITWSLENGDDPGDLAGRLRRLAEHLDGR